jgi:hypothetical protein
MPNILVSDSVYQRLLGRATSFEDSPEDVIARLLEQAGDHPVAAEEQSRAPQPSRASPGSVLPVHGYWVPILRSLGEAGGSAPSTEIIDGLASRMQGLLTPLDFEPLKSGEIRWRNRARFARLRMKERGFLSDTSHRGVWEITDLGREYLASKESQGVP